jgi:hypothetical protein
MNRTCRTSLLLSAIFTMGVVLGGWIHQAHSSAAPPDRHANAMLLRLIGHQPMGRSLLFSVYCDVERGHLVYTYTVGGGDSPSGDLAVVKDGCKGGIKRG